MLNMSSADGEPPAKKRRFFADHDTLPLDGPTTDNTRNDRPHAKSSVSPRPSKLPTSSHEPSRPPASPHQPTIESNALVAFDQDAFESLVGDKVSPEILAIIHANNDPPQDTLDARYIGAFGAEGWATRSGTNLVKHGDVVKIERQKAQQTPLRMRLAAAGKSDVIVRFTDSNGTEIGRLAKDAANWISSLIDQNVCKFEGICVYAPERLRTNDTIFLQLRCFLKMSVFQGSVLELLDNRSTGMFEERESAEERNLRLRQVGIVRLFQELNFAPTKSNAASANSARQGLLDAAELAEKKNKLPRASSQSDDVEEGEELEQGQLDALYRKAQSFDFNTPEAEPANTFAMNLRPYQKQSLYWMLAKEKDEKNEARQNSMHPLWEEYTWPLKDVDDQDLPQIEGQTTFYVNPYSGEMSLSFPYQEQHCLGGILADEMGLGKTIQMLSLIHSHKAEVAMHQTNQPTKPSNALLRTLPRSPNSQSIAFAPKTTLVVAPMSLLAQWQNEAENASKEGTLKSLVYYGNDKMDNIRTLCCGSNLTSAPDIIITSYGVVFLVLLPPKSIEIVDVELSQAERAVYDYVFAKAKRTFSANIEKGTVMKAYTTIFAQILRLRQTCCHPTLVRNQDIVTEEELAGAEADAAAGLSDDMDLQSLIQQFTATTSDEKDANAFGAHVLEQIRDEAISECPICSEEPMIDQTVTGCWHSACKQCLLDYMKHHTDRHETPRCFNCRKALNARDIFEVVRNDDDASALQSPPKISLQRLGVNESSSKVVSLMKHLRALRREHPLMKSVVFSQFTSFMSLIEPALAKANMKFLRLDGTINQKTRAAVLKEFADCDRFTILLISLRAGGVGLNLTQAKRVYMMDPWWSFAIEAQAIDRVHRMGQDAEVKVYRFICKDSVEERMLKVQDRKKFM
ncbi:hypothetical protein ONZ43_g5137 [Nemania bipapillata]|uniref:Uncharacterized protein n=1 Tax=Nemania bipapillata TaxID=110536 RepID=A0ACC2IE89_9PEZI|nr:hypothetical protein ONZ43_g5137 [Nemania bipapillata]